MDFLDETAEHRSRTHLNIRGDAFRRKATNDARPTGLVPTSAAPGHRLLPRRPSSGSASTLATTGTLGSRTVKRAQFRLETVLGWLHQGSNGTVRSPASGTDQFRAERLRAIACPLHRGRMTGDDDLLRPLMLAGLTTWPSAASSQAWRTTSSVVPTIAAIAPSPTGTASCM